ncbi:unnamed protein product [Sphagnum jensenii]|uniref:DEK-C domain-containing protein n=1 Tax=Sphagnum jensenii TaxID=128206 RepID=A0ABP0W3Q2_9BRYO
MAEEREDQTAMEMVENAEQTEGKAVENHQTGKEQEVAVVEDVKGDAMDIEEKGKLEAGIGTKENEKAEDKELEEAKEELVQLEEGKEEEKTEKEEEEEEEEEEREEEEKEEEEEEERAEEENGTPVSTKKRPGKVKKGRKKSEEISTPRGSSGKRQRQRKEIFPFFTDRPTRERKSIERFIAFVEKDTNKEVQIKKGEGTPFKDIPNVAYKLSKISKNDEILSMLHSLLFNKRGKAAVLKQRILQFSGYVWTENQEKERARVKEKLERYTKEGLVLLIDVLDLHLPRTGKKEELVGKVLEFLEKPHKTTDILLEEKEQKSKIDGGSSTKRGRRKAGEESDDGESAKSEDNDSLEEEEEEEVEKKRFTFKEEDEDSDEEEKEKKKSAKKSSNTSSKKSSKVEIKEVESEQEEEEKSESEEAPPKKSRKKTPAKISAPDSPPNVSSKPVEKVYLKNARKQNKEKEKEKEKKAKERKQRENEKETKEKEKGREKSTPRPQGKKSDTVKDSKPRKSKKVPSDDELQSEIRELLKDADFSKVTFTDVITQLEGKFGVSLTEHKSHVKKLIKEEINKLADDGDDEPETGAGSQGEAEGEPDPGADAEMDEGEPEPESEIETEAEAEAVTELQAKPKQKEPEENPEPEQEEKPEIEAEVEAEAAPKVEAEASNAGAAPEVETVVTEEVADMVVEAGTRPKPGPEPTPTLEAEAEENTRPNVVAEPELKTQVKETGNTEGIVEENQDVPEKAAAEPKESIEPMVE